MDEKIDKAIDTALGQVRTNLKPDEALKQTQAVLNLMHAKSVWANAEQAAKVPRSKTNN